MRHSSVNGRPGLMTMWALIILTFLSMLLALTTTQLMASRYTLDRRQNQLQALWLARSGQELAIARLLDKPADYKGESVEILPDSEVRIEVKARSDAKDVFVVTSEARYPLEGRDKVLLSLTRRYRRVVEKNRARLEVLSAEPRGEAREEGPQRPAEKINPPREAP